VSRRHWQATSDIRSPALVGDSPEPLGLTDAARELFYVQGRRRSSRYIGPAILGGGHRSFPDGVRVDLELPDERHFGDGVVKDGADGS